ncbi:lactate utilization protein C [Kitasatospora sp. NPDC048194]|uniref:LutC/YkgG family protein n=1 Tax=Kitasatospora sp. NPDC048194 TaxID=3364045 RepID=UPI003718DE0F
MDSRDAVLRRIRAALADVPADEGPEDVPVPRAYRRGHAAPGQDLTRLFAERVRDYLATVTRTDRTGLPGAIAAALTARRATRLAVPDGFPAGFLPSGAFEWHREPLGVAALDALDGVVTLAAVGIAVTGTIVLDTGPGQGGRALSLVPDYHLCVIRAEQIVDDVPEALARLDPRLPLTFVSGPSATSDIELTRVEGVHGPRTLDVLLVDPGEPVPPAGAGGTAEP